MGAPGPRIAVLPARNEARTLPLLVPRLREHIDIVIVVDDASTDTTPAVARELGCTVVRCETRVGVGGATQTGLRTAAAMDPGWVVCLDADGQHDPAWVADAAALAAERDAQVVFADRFADTSLLGSAPVTKVISNTVAWHFLRALVGRQPASRDVSCGFRWYAGDTVSALLNEHLLPRHLGYAFVHASYVTLQSAPFRVAVVAVPAIYGPEASRGTPIAEARSFFTWLAGYATMASTAELWCRRLDEAPGLFTEAIATWDGRDIVIVADVSATHVCFSYAGPSGGRNG